MNAPIAKKPTKTAGPAPVQTIPLGGGATLLLSESHTLPLVSLTLSFRSGSAFDPPGKDGATKLALRMLRRGARGRSAHEIEDELDRLGAELQTEVFVSSSAIHAQVLERNLGAFVELLGTLLSEPTFDETELEKLRREALAEIVEARDSDKLLAQTAFRKAVFRGHPYARGATGISKTVAALTRDDVMSAYRKIAVQGNVALGFSGDIDPARAEEMGRRIANALAAGPALPDPVPDANRIAGRHLLFVDKPERTQTQILIGGLGTSAHDADHVPLGIATAVFGGSFTSRLMREVRSKRGWSYGAYARLPVDKHRQSFSMWTFPAATDAAACLALEIGLLETFLDKGIDPKELSFIQKFLSRSYAFDVDTASKRLHQALDVEVLGLPADYYSGYLAKLGAVQLDEANAAVKARLSKDDLLVVVVGTASEILEKIKESIPGLGDTTVVPFDREDEAL